MTAKIQRNLGIIGVSAKNENATVGGVADTTSQRLYLKTDPAVEVYGYKGSVAHASHSSTSITSTIGLGTAYSDREIYIAVATMKTSTASSTAPVASVSLGGNSFSLLSQTVQTTTTNSSSVAFFRYVDNGSLGTSATYTITFNLTQVHTGVFAFTTGPTALSNVDSYGANGPGGASWGTAGSVSSSPGGFVLYGAIAQNSSVPTNSSVPGYTVAHFFDAGSNEHVVLAYQDQLSGGTVTVPQPTYTPNGQSSFLAISRES
jgi:hypothetical protein